jgi:hypothetical protein
VDKCDLKCDLFTTASGSTKYHRESSKEHCHEKSCLC